MLWLRRVLQYVLRTSLKHGVVVRKTSIGGCLWMVRQGLSG